MSKTLLITGGASGIGAETARHAATRLDPRHHAAQLLADFLDLVVVVVARRIALKRGWPALYSCIHSEVNLPVWMSLSTRFISALVSA
jgi:NAD(P)-dependent dehydrogenase (short-subunit alcohol dehydrogenase family)